METASLGRQCLNAEHQVPMVLLSLGDILEKTRTAASFAFFFFFLTWQPRVWQAACTLEFTSPLSTPKLRLESVLNCFALVDYLV